MNVDIPDHVAFYGSGGKPPLCFYHAVLRVINDGDRDIHARCETWEDLRPCEDCRDEKRKATAP